MSSIVTGESRGAALRLGIFMLFGALCLAAVTLYVNGKPFWWRSCELVHIQVEDATGLKSKSPVRSLGLEIGYLQTVELQETAVRLGICLTAPVEILPTTRAYIRGEGFLGDKFVELKPVRYQRDSSSWHRFSPAQVAIRVASAVSVAAQMALLPAAHAQSETTEASPPPARTQKSGSSKEIPMGGTQQDMQQMMQKVDGLVTEIKGLTTNLKDAIHPEEFRKALQQLNKTLENASKTFSPESGLNTTAQRTLGKLEDAVEQLRDQITRINQGKGSVGRLLNDPSFADQLEKTLERVNQLINKMDKVSVYLTLGADRLTAYNDTRGFVHVGIWPKPDRYYLLGAAIDPRGRITSVTTFTTVNSQTVQTQTTQIEQGSFQLTGMLGKVLWNRLDLSLGVLYGDGALSVAGYLGPEGAEDRYQARVDLFARGQGVNVASQSLISTRLTLTARPISNLYVRAGMESFTKVNGTFPIIMGAGLHFEDEDLKLLFSLL